MGGEYDDWYFMGEGFFVLVLGQVQVVGVWEYLVQQDQVWDVIGDGGLGFVGIVGVDWVVIVFVQGECDYFVDCGFVVDDQDVFLYVFIVMFIRLGLSLVDYGFMICL